LQQTVAGQDSIVRRAGFNWYVCHVPFILSHP
jgi:hypothetical protein